MSRIGNKHIPLPEGVNVEILDHEVKVSGKKGNLEVKVPNGITVIKEDNVLICKRANDSVQMKENHGTTRALIHNAIVGVSEGYSKSLVIVGIGYRAAMRGSDIVLNVGYSHEIVLKVLDGVSVTCPSATEITVSGISKEKVGQMAALIRSVRKPEPYGGKGVMYKGEHIIRKEGKRAGGKK